MSPRIVAALAAAASLLVASPALANSTVTTPADGATFLYDSVSPPQIPVSGTSDAAQIDLRCAEKDGATWHFGNPLNGLAINVVGGSFSEPSLVLPFNSDKALCKLVAVPTGTTPTDLTGLSGPNLRLLIVRGKRWNHGGSGNDGKQYDYYSTAGGTTADSGLTAAGDGGLEFMSLLSSDPGELGGIFSGADRILPVDPTSPAPTISGEDGPLTGILVDGVNAFTGPSWNEQVTPSLQIVFRDLLPFPLVTSVPGQAADGSFTVAEHDVVVSCNGTDAMYYPPQGATCSSLVGAGVQLDLVTTMSPAGNVVERVWRISSTDGRAHAVKLWLGHTASTNAMTRAWKLPGDAGYATHAAGDTVPVSGTAPWIARFQSVSAADGDTSEGVGGFGISAVPTALRFRQSYDPQASYAIAVPASGSAQLRSVYVGDATQAALDRDLAAAFPGSGGGGGGRGGSGGGGSGGGLIGVPGATLTRTAKAVFGTDGTLALGYALACPAVPATVACTASIALTQPVRRAARRHHARARKSAKRRRAAARRARPRVLGTLNVSVAAGKTSALSLKIARRYRAAFKAGHVTMTARLIRPGAEPQTIVKPLPVKIARPRARRRAHHGHR